MEFNDWYVYAYLNPNKPGVIAYGPYRFDWTVGLIAYGRDNASSRRLLDRELDYDPIVTKILDNLTEDKAKEICEKITLEVFPPKKPTLNLDGSLRKTHLSGKDRKKHVMTKKYEYKNKTGPKVFSESHKRNISKAKKGVSVSQNNRSPQTEETKAKISATKKRRNNSHKAFGNDFRRKAWIVIHPDGSEDLIYNLNKFCQENDLHHGAMIEIADSKRNHHKDWKCRRAECLK